MLKILQKFFAFCGEENRRKFKLSIILSVIQAVFSALRIPAIAVLLQACLEHNVTVKSILLSLGIMLVSVIGIGIIKSKSSMLQTEAGYGTCADKRIEIAEHIRCVVGLFCIRLAVVGTELSRNCSGASGI